MTPHTRPGYLVIDPFMGSAPVGEAYYKTDRRFVGWEIDEQNFRGGGGEDAEAGKTYTCEVDPSPSKGIATRALRLKV